MYFIVFFEAINKNVVLPANWIMEIENHMEKFLNYGINSNQVFRCFYPANKEAFDENGCPKSEFQPDFDLLLRDNFDEDGCFFGKVKKCRGINFFL